MTNTVADIEEADVILITGSNTTENHPVLSSVVKRAVTAKGAKLIVADPRRIRITRYAAKWLRQNLGTDVAWLNGLMHVIIKEGLHSKEFIENRTEGFDELHAGQKPDHHKHRQGRHIRRKAEIASPFGEGLRIERDAKAECPDQTIR